MLLSGNRCEQCGEPLDKLRCASCQAADGAGFFAIAHRRLPAGIVGYLAAILGSRLYWGLLIFAITPFVLLTVHINLVVGMMIYFSLFWFFVFQPLVSTHLGLRPLFTDLFAYGFTGVAGTSFALIVEAFWFARAGILFKTSALMIAVPAYILGVGLTEEFAKQLVVLIFLLIHRARSRRWSPLAYMMLGVSSGLGFSAVENISYIQRGMAFEVMHHAVGLSTVTALSRALYTPFLHAVWAGIAAYGLGLVAQSGFRRWQTGLGFLLLAAVFHGVYDATDAPHPYFAIFDIACSYLVFLGLLLNSRRAKPTRTNA